MLLSLVNVNKCFSELEVLRDITLHLREREIICILGPSGCGKSTILRIIAGLENVNKGEILREYSNLSYVFQEDRLLKWRTVEENIRIVRDEQDEAMIKELIKSMELDGFEKAYPKTLSGGMRQRVSIARAFYYGGDLMLMDEPLKSLDYDLKYSLIDNLIDTWENASNSIVYITHDVDEAVLLGNRIFVLGSRPCSVLSEIEITTKQRERALDSDESLRVRKEIIKHLIGN